MDITFRTAEGNFNYRVCAVLLHEGKILAMKDENIPYYYLPGGRVNLHETAEHALLRELKEELGIRGEIVRPLWLNQSFFVEDVRKEKFHELCLYFLVDAAKTGLLSKGDSFTLYEGGRKHWFEWLAFDRLESEYFYPIFLKKKIFELPEGLTILAEYE